MREIRIEVSSESEAIEFCLVNGYKYVKVYEGKGAHYGSLMLLAYASGAEQTKDVQRSQAKDWVVMAETGGSGVMYESKVKGGFTFREDEAMLLTKYQAEVKARAMRKRGNYMWKAVHIKLPKAGGII